MKKLYSASVIVLVCVQLVLAQRGDTAVVNRFISRQAKAAGAEEYKDVRKIVSADVNGDGKADLVVLYALEGFGGGNSYRQYLAVFLDAGKGFRNVANAAVGGKLNRSVELISVAGGKINLKTESYASNDAACCPSKKGKTQYIFTNSRLKEVSK